jgi:hypothetical protein
VLAHQECLPEADAAVVGRHACFRVGLHPERLDGARDRTEQGFPGCWRCHDDELTTADGKHTIPQDCDNCHTFLVEDSSTPPEFASN